MPPPLRNTGAALSERATVRALGGSVDDARKWDPANWVSRPPPHLSTQRAQASGNLFRPWRRYARVLVAGRPSRVATPSL